MPNPEKPQPDHMSDGPVARLVESMHRLTVELETHRTHAHGFMAAQEAINRRLTDIADSTNKRLQEIEVAHALTRQRVEQLERQVAEVMPALAELRNTITWWVGGGVGAMAVLQILIQVVLNLPWFKH